MKKEIWKDIPLYEGKYQASSLGNIRSLNYHREGYEKILSPRTNRGYYYLSLVKDGKVITERIHSLIMRAFIGDKPEGLVINHKNGVKTDNRLENLEYCTSSYNNQHAFRILGRKPNKTNLGKLGALSPLSKKVAQYDLNGNLLKIFDGQAEAGRQTGVRQSDISACCRGIQKTAKGFTWKHI